MDGSIPDHVAVEHGWWPLIDPDLDIKQWSRCVGYVYGVPKPSVQLSYRIENTGPNAVATASYAFGGDVFSVGFKVAMLV